MSVDRTTAGWARVIIRINPSGTIQLPAIGSVPAQGLTLPELKSEIEARYDRRFYGVEVTPILEDRAVRLRRRGSQELGTFHPGSADHRHAGHRLGRRLERRGESEERRRVSPRRQLVSDGHSVGSPTRSGRQAACPTDEIWLRDSDVVLVPKSALLVTDDWIQLFFTHGLYGVVPFSLQTTFTNLTTL